MNGQRNDLCHLNESLCVYLAVRLFQVKWLSILLFYFSQINELLECNGMPVRNDIPTLPNYWWDFKKIDHEEDYGEIICFHLLLLSFQQLHWSEEICKWLFLCWRCCAAFIKQEGYNLNFILPLTCSNNKTFHTQPQSLSIANKNSLKCTPDTAKRQKASTVSHCSCQGLRSSESWKS